MDTSNSTVAGGKLTAAFVLPLVLFLVVAGFYPDVAGSYEGDGFGNPPPPGVSSATWIYMAMVAVQVVLAGGLIVYFWPVYSRQFPIRVTPLSWVVGLIGFGLWILLTAGQWESTWLGWIGLELNRPGFNPFTIEQPGVRAGFLLLRFLLLVVLVPIVEELFLRGWLMRWIQNPDFDSVKLTELSWMALGSAAVYGVLTHPTEAIAAAVWFSLVSWLMWRTGSLWDCVVAHAVTNLLLGIYVLNWGQWQLW